MLPVGSEGAFPLDDDDQFSHPEINAYGRLSTPDCEFLITTRTVLICRDLVAFKRYKALNRYEQRVAEHKSKGLDPPTPPKSLSRTQGKDVAPSSQGGLLHELPDEGRQGSASGNVGDDFEPPSAEGGVHPGQFDQYPHHTPNAAPVDIHKLLPDNKAVARLFIHGQGPDFFMSTKGISREHMKIQYNAKKRLWEAHALGRNGFFHGDQLITLGQTIVLNSGSRLQIQNIPILFRLEGIDEGKDGSERYMEGHKMMAFDFSGEVRHPADSSDEEMEEEGVYITGGSKLGSKPSKGPHARSLADARRRSLEESDDDEEDYDGSPDSADIRDTVEKQEQSFSDVDQLGGVPFAPRKRGPGRPPKNGIMSKREEKLIRKQMLEDAKRNIPPLDANAAAAEKRKVGRPRKHLADGLDGSAEKRPYKVRKIKGDDVSEEVEGDKPAKERSQKHKTPPLELRKEDFTEEQLQKPTKNYQLLIDEIMSSAPEQGYSLKQIYKRIQEKWPHFYFRVDTKGWESSVRHNLLGSECFEKKEGNWHRKAGVPLDAGKKRKPSDSTAEARPAMYNGYGQLPYQHQQIGQPGQLGPPNGLQMMGHPAALGQPNLPPRYPPNGQAYQIPQGPHTMVQRAGQAPTQGFPRPAFAQQQAPPPGSAQAYAPVRPPPKPQQTGGPQPPTQNPAFGHKPQPPRPMVAGSATATGPNVAQRPPIGRPGVGLQTHQSQSLAHNNNSRSTPSVPQQPQATSPSFKPLIEAPLRSYIRDFRDKTVNIVRKQSNAQAELITMSVISRGLRLTNHSLALEEPDYEQHVISVFKGHLAQYPKWRAKLNANPAGPITSTSVQTPSSTGGVSTGGAADITPDAITNTIGAGAIQSTSIRPTAATDTSGNGPIQPIHATSASATPNPTTPASLALPISAQPSTQPAPPSNPGTAAHNGPANASGGTSHLNSSGSAINSSGLAPKPMTAKSEGPISSLAGPSASATGGLQADPNAQAPATAAISNTATTSAHVAEAGASSSTNVVGLNGSAAAAPSSGVSAPIVTTAITANVATGVPRSNSTGSGPLASVPSSAAAIDAGPSRPQSSTPAPSIYPGTLATPNVDENVQVLSPKLIEAIEAFKKSIMSTLVPKLGTNSAECLVLSAVYRTLGITDQTFVLSKTDRERAHLAAAENVCMTHLQSRFKRITATVEMPSKR